MSKFNFYKRILALLLIGIVFISCGKDNLEDTYLNDQLSTEVSVDLAKQVAFNFTKDEAFIGKPNKVNSKIPLRSSIKTKSISIPGFEKKKLKEVLKIYDNNDKVSLFVIKFLPNGYVIVPSTKKEIPILAFSNNGIFNENDMPLGLKNWIDSRISIIKNLKQDIKIKVSENTQKQWDACAPPEDEEEIISGGTIHEQKGPLLETRWGQGYGYNEYVKFKNCTNGNSLTGCVATAMAQVMRYHKYPDTYNWSIMPNIIEIDTPIDNSTNEVAKLMRDVGQSVNMQYKCGVSSAHTFDVKNALISTFGYSNGIKYLDFNLNDVIEEIKYNKPVILRGYDPAQGGHAWVCDGSRILKHIIIHNPGTVYEYETKTFSQPYLHMNWGWNDEFDTDDNWFFYGTPKVSGYDFSTEYKMMINIQP